MARWRCFLAGFVALGALGSGCAMNRPMNPFGSTASKSSTSKLAKKSTKSGSTPDEDETSSGGRSDVAASKGSKSSGTDDDDSRSDGGRGDPSASPTANGGGHDPETMAYINQQLRDAAPDERTALLAELKGLHPEAVRQILRGRRMALNHARQQELAAHRSRSSTQPGTIQPTAGESPLVTSRASSADVSPGGAMAPGRNGPMPVGHSSAYRADGSPENPAETAYATVPASPAAAGRGNPAVGQLAADTQNFNQAPAASAAPMSRDAGIRPASVSIGVPMNAGAGPAAATGAGSPGEGSTRELRARLISAMEAEAVAQQPDGTEVGKQAFAEKQAYLRMEYLMSGQQERALQAIPGLDPADQEFLQQTFWGLTNYFDVSSIPSSTERAAQTVTQITNAVLRLQEKANLELRNVTFCHKISNFGNFEKYPREEFSPGQEVLLYAEVANIHSEPIPDGKFRTSLKSTIEIYHHGSQGELIERVDLPETVDVCRTHRRDYFHSYQYTIPTKLTLGPHLLKLTVEDQLSRRVATYTLNFTVK